ncbi:MAG: 30S ribosomal protein S6 [Clostridia bacterium]
MRKYEAIFIIDNTLEEEVQKSIIEKIKAEIESDGGTVDKVDEWGKRRLAYPIQFKNEGYYVLIEFSAGPEVPLLLERQYRITEGIMKGLIVKIQD